MDQKISKRITFIGFCMTCVIVLFHCYDGELSPISDTDREIYLGINYFFATLSRLALCWFFAVSGFLLFRDFDLKRNYLSKIKRRVFSLLVPYVLWELAGGLLNRSLLREPGTVLANIFLLQKWPPIGPLWYMYAIFLFAVISPVFWFLLKWRKPWGGCVLFALIFALVYYNEMTRGSFIFHFLSFGYMRSIVTYLPAYLTGCYFGMHDRDRDHPPFTDCIVLLLAALMAKHFYEDIFLQTVNCLLPILMIYAFPAGSVEGRRKRLFNLAFLMYATHSYLTVHLAPAVRSALLGMMPETWVANLGARFIVLGAVILLAAAVWLALSLICPPVLKVITGGRVKPLREIK